MKRLPFSFGFHLCGASGSGDLRWPVPSKFSMRIAAGPMKGLKAAFEAKNRDVTVNLTSGVSRQLADRILNGDTCDVFAPSSPQLLTIFSRNKGPRGM